MHNVDCRTPHSIKHAIKSTNLQEANYLRIADLINVVGNYLTNDKLISCTIFAAAENSLPQTISGNFVLFRVSFISVNLQVGEASF